MLFLKSIPGYRVPGRYQIKRGRQVGVHCNMPKELKMVAAHSVVTASAAYFVFYCCWIEWACVVLFTRLCCRVVVVVVVVSCRFHAVQLQPAQVGPTAGLPPPLTTSPLASHL